MYCNCGIAYFHGVNTPFMTSLPCVSMCEQTIAHHEFPQPLSFSHTCAHTQTPKKPPIGEIKRWLENKTLQLKNRVKNSSTYWSAILVSWYLKFWASYVLPLLFRVGEKFKSQLNSHIFFPSNKKMSPREEEKSEELMCVFSLVALRFRTFVLLSV